MKRILVITEAILKTSNVNEHYDKKVVSCVNEIRDLIDEINTE